MRCPACGHENIPGVDACAECHASLMQADNLTSTTGGHHSIMTDLVSDIDPRPPITISADSSVADAIALMLNENIGCVLVTDADGRLVGIFSETDVVRQVAGIIDDPTAVAVGQLMTPRPSTLPVDVPIAHALHLMSLHGFRHVPLVDEAGRPEGVISSRDIVDFIEEHFSKA